MPARSTSSSGGTSPCAAIASSRSRPPPWRQSRTRVAPPWLIRISPASCSRLSASRTAWRLAPSCSDSRRSDGTAAPGASSPERISVAQARVDAIGQEHWLDQLGRLVVPDDDAACHPFPAHCADGRDHRRPRERGELGGHPGGVRDPRRSRAVLVPALQDGAGRVVGRGRRRRARAPLPHADRLGGRRAGRGGGGSRRLPRRRARRLVRGRAPHGVPAAAAQRARPVGGPRRGQGRRPRLGGDLLRDPHARIPAPRGQPRARARRRRPRPGPRGAGAGGLPHDRRGGRDRRRAPRRSPQRVRRRRVHRGGAPRTAPRRDADRLPGRGADAQDWRA